MEDSSSSIDLNMRVLSFILYLAAGLGKSLCYFEIAIVRL